MSPDGTQVAFAADLEEENNYDIYVAVVGSSEAPLRLTTDREMDWHPVWSPDGQWLVFLRGTDESVRPRVRRISPQGGQETTLLDRMCVPDPWSPDSGWFTCHEGRDARGILMGFRNGEPPRNLTQPPEGTRDTWPVLSPDGSRLIFLRGNIDGKPDLLLLEMGPDGEPRGEPRVVLKPSAQVMGLTWTRDSQAIVLSLVPGGSHLAPVAGGDLGKAQLYRWRIGDRRSAPQPLHAGEGAYDPAMARLQDRLVFTQFEDQSDIWQATGDRIVKHRVSSSRDEFRPQFSPDGSQIAFYSSRSGVFQVWVAAADGTRARQLTTQGPAGAARWSPDGRWLVYQGDDGQGHADIYRMGVPDGAPQRLTSDPADDLAPSVSNDGRWIYFTSNRSWSVPGIPDDVRWRPGDARDRWWR